MTCFSVVMPLYNKESFVVDAVNSVLAQEFGDLELIVVDDGSTDGGFARLTALSDPRVKIIRQPNAGVSAARNRGISLAGGSYITFLDADDLWSPQHLVRVADLIDQDSLAIAWAVGYSEFEHGCDAHSMTAVTAGSNAVSSGSFDQHDFLIAWTRSPFFWTGSITIRAKTLRALQPCFPTGERQGEDQDLWFRLSELGPIRFSSLTTTAFYRRGIGDSLAAQAVLAPLPSILRLQERSLTQNPRIRKAVRHLAGRHMLHVAWANCVVGRRAAALRFLSKTDPSVSPAYWLRILLGLLLPTRMLRVALARIKSNRVRRIGEL